MKNLFKNYLVEFIGAFFLVFTICATALFGATGVIPAIAIGFALMIMVYAGGHISGGHYNPAVSLAAAIRGALSFKQVIPYWIAQILGGVCAALLASKYAVAETVAPEACPFALCGLLVGEFLFTFALCYVVLLTATSKKAEGNSYYGLAIGATVTVGAFAVGGAICHGAFNPAVAIALGTAGLATVKCIGYTVLANLVAAVVAAFTFKFVETEE